MNSQTDDIPRSSSAVFSINQLDSGRSNQNNGLKKILNEKRSPS